MEVKPDLHTTKFSPQNAFFFATLSNVAYKNQKEAKGLVVGNSTNEGMGFEQFYWFQVLKWSEASCIVGVYMSRFICPVKCSHAFQNVRVSIASLVDRLHIYTSVGMDACTLDPSK